MLVSALENCNSSCCSIEAFAMSTSKRVQPFGWSACSVCPNQWLLINIFHFAPRYPRQYSGNETGLPKICADSQTLFHCALTLAEACALVLAEDGSRSDDSIPPFVSFVSRPTRRSILNSLDFEKQNKPRQTFY